MTIRATIFAVLGGAAVTAVAVAALPGGGSVTPARRGVVRRRTPAPASASSRLACRLRRPRFRTLPDLRPVGFCFAGRAGDEDLLVTPRPDPRKNPGEQFGLMLLSPRGRLLWYQRRPTKVHDLKVVRYRGRPALAFFQQDGHHGYYQLLDDRYRPIDRVLAGHGYPTNLHELQMGTGDSAWVSADVRVPVPRLGTVIEYVVQRVDVASGRVLSEWHSLDHVAPSTSYERRPRRGAWDYFHGNSISPPTPRDPTVLISSRNTSSVYAVDPATGRTRWILGGKRDQFGLPPRWRFCAQHDVHRLADGDIMLFDNGGADVHGGPPQCPVHPARAMVFRLDPTHRRARLVRSLSSRSVTPGGRGFLSAFVGSARPLDEGRVLVDWGQVPRVSVLGRSGREDALLRLQYWSYRAVPARWEGHPGGEPAVAAQRTGRAVDVWASWNGATAIRHWQVLAGPDAGHLAPVGAPAPFADLETRIRVDSTAPAFAVRALGPDGAVLGQSKAVSAR